MWQTVYLNSTDFEIYFFSRELSRIDSVGGGFVGGGKPRDSSNDEMYWRKLSSVIDFNKERLWDAMIEGFEKYSHVLKERAKLIQETDNLKQQVLQVLTFFKYFTGK